MVRVFPKAQKKPEESRVGKDRFPAPNLYQKDASWVMPWQRRKFLEGIALIGVGSDRTYGVNTWTQPGAKMLRAV